MKNIYSYKCVFILLFCLPAILGFAQTYKPATLNSAGGSTTLTGMTFEYSIGEMTLIHTASSTNIIITQGVLQPGDIGTGISDHLLDESQIHVYPNPVNDIVNVDVNLPSSGTLQLHLYDLNGKLVSQKEIAVNSEKENTSLSFTHLAAGNYVLNAVFKTGWEVYHQNFKIQKMK